MDKPIVAERADDRAAEGRPARWLDVALVGFSGIATFFALVREHGASPTVWTDTLVDDTYIQRCLEWNECTTVGVGATVGIYHTVAYLDFRTLLGWLGVGPDGTYLTLLAMSALGLALTTLVACRLAGRWAGAIAALLGASLLGIPMQGNVVSDVAPMPAMGAVLLLASVVAAERRQRSTTVLVAVLAGIVANVYATGIVFGATALWIGLLSPAPRRWVDASIAVLTFAATAFVLAPGTWIVDAEILLSHRANHAPLGHAYGVFGSIVSQSAALATVLFIGAVLVTRPLARLLAGPAAVLVPLFAAFAGGTWLGVLEPQEKYLAQIAFAVAATIGVALTFVLRSPRWPSQLRPVQDLLVAPRSGRIALAIAGLAIAWGHPEPTRDFAYRFRDLNAAIEGLDQHGWDRNLAYRALRTPDETVHQSILEWATGHWRPHARATELEVAYLLRTPIPRLTEEPPAGTTIVSRDAHSATVLSFACSWIDWRAFTVCVTDASRPEGTCTETGYPERTEWEADVFPPGMPVPDVRRDRAEQTLTLRLPLSPRADCPVQSIHMPAVPEACPGRIVRVVGGRSEISADGRWARLERAGEGPTELVLEWEMGSAACFSQYRGHPPFFLAGPPPTTRFLSTLLNELDRPMDAPGPPVLDSARQPPPALAPPYVPPPPRQARSPELDVHHVSLPVALALALIEALVIALSVGFGVRALARSAFSAPSGREERPSSRTHPADT